MKPTAAIINAVINHLVSNSGQISQDIRVRDEHRHILSSAISCRFVSELSNNRRLVFEVEFTYEAPPSEERRDDITVRVEVTEQGGAIQIHPIGGGTH